MKVFIRFVCLLTLFFFSRSVWCQQLTAVEKEQVIDSICMTLENHYVLPEVGGNLARHLKVEARSASMGVLRDPEAFADTLTQLLYRNSQDHHFRVIFDPSWVNDSRSSLTAEDSLALRKERALRFREVNYGFREIRNMDGNIGYLKLTCFADPVAAGPATVAAMNSLSGSDALIIDIRDNGGGFRESTELIASYLFDENKAFTLPYVPGSRMTGIPVYLLINRYSYSAAEGFAQMLKLHHRATLVGENTGGAAHGIARFVLSDRFYIVMPVTRPQPDWEGVGIEPDIRVDPADALHAARVSLLQELARLYPDRKAEYQWLLEDEQVAATPVAVGDKEMKACTGSYGQYSIYMQDHRLYYHRTGDQPYRLLPMGERLYRFVDTDDIRIRFIMHRGKIDQLTILYKDGGSKTVDKK